MRRRGRQPLGEATAAARLPPARLVAFVIPQFALGAITAPFFFVLPTYYVQNTSATLAALGTALVVSRLMDAVTDPLIGWLSDITRSPWGARKPWIVLGAVSIGLSILMLFTPSPEVGVTYFLLWSLVFYAGWTAFSLPYDAWLTELTRDYQDRSRIAGYKGMASQAGGLAFFAVSASGALGDGMSATLMAAVGWVSLILLPGLTLLAAKTVPATSYQAPSFEPPRLNGLWISLRSNAAFRVLLGAQLLGGLGGGIFLGTQILFLDGYFGLGASYGIVFLVYQGVHIASLPVWLHLVNRFGKHRSWAMSWGLSAAMAPLVLLLEPGPGALVLLLVITALRSFVSGADMIAPRALMADAIDYGILKTGENAAGSYFAASMLAVKLCAALSSGIGFWLLDFGGFDPAPGASNDASAMLTLIVVSLFLPMICNVAAASLIWLFPIDRRRADIIRRRIEARPAARNAVS